MLDETVVNQDNPAVSGDAPQNDTADTGDVDATLDALELDVTEPGEPTVASSVPDGTIDRLNQQLAEQSRLLNSLGIDPESDVIDQFKLGIIGPEDLKRQITAPTQMEQGPVSLYDKIRELKNEVQSGGTITEDRYRKDMGAAIDVLGEFVQQQETSNRERTIEMMMDRNIQASKQAFGKSETVNALPPELKSSAESLMLGMTDIEVGKFSRTLPPDRATSALQPRVYYKMAQEAAKTFDAIYQHAFEAGKRAAVGNIQRNPKGVNPISPGGAPSSPPPSAKTFSVDNLNKNVEQYLAASRLRV